jgi:16S rRNA (uracil1498-N3)-methyltransferase
MESFYVPPDNISDTTLSIHGEELHHLTRVLRTKTGDRILAVDGRGTAYECLVERVQDQEAVCTVERIHEHFNEPAVDVTMMLPVLKNHHRIEWIVEKGTELGVRRFVPVYTKRSIPHRIRYDRLRSIAQASMKQCKRSFLPEILDGRSLNELLTIIDVSFDKVFVGHEGAPVSGSLRALYGQIPDQRVLLLTGPEGGFTHEELDMCQRNGAQAVSLGVRRYRAETAALIMAVYIIFDKETRSEVGR